MTPFDQHWRPPIPDDHVAYEPGVYAIVSGLDDSGEETVAMSVELDWEEKLYAHWFIAAGHWGPAPYALLPCRAAHRVTLLGTWPEVAQQHQDSITCIFDQSKSMSPDGVCNDSALMLVRAALRLEKWPLPSWESQARSVLLDERAKDESSYEKRHKQFFSAHPELKADIDRLQEELNGRLGKCAKH